MRPTFGSTRGSFTTRAKSTMRPPAATNCPQSTHNPTHLPRWADSGLSPMSTPPNTVARISPWVLLRRSRLGTHRITRRRAALRRLMSPRSISFQVEPESSTVVHRSRYGRCTHRGDAWRDTEKPLVRPLLWCGSKGRYGRGDDNSWSHRFEVPACTRRLRRRRRLGCEEFAN